jgi:hypothetical protein
VNLEAVDRIARAVLYEGYLLYPYRASAIKNRKRFHFGVVYPRAYSEKQQGTDAWRMRTECLIRGVADTRLEATVRFLRLWSQESSMTCPVQPTPGKAEGAAKGSGVPIEGEGQPYGTWQGAAESALALPGITPGDLLVRPLRQRFCFEAKVEAAAGGGAPPRRYEAFECGVDVRAERLAPDVYRLTVLISNETPLEGPVLEDREEVLLRSLVSTHTTLGVTGGEFVSLIDPPDELREAAAGCSNEGCWPVLVGEEGQRNSLLSSPILLYDYPAVAPESPGDLFDGTEIDEILSLRILTLAEEEKREMRALDERAAAILERTETLPPEQWRRLHGAVRGLRPVRPGEAR